MKLSAVVLFVSLPSLLCAHPGNTDANGGHTDRKTGLYHNHGVPHRTRGGGSSSGSARSAYRYTAPVATPSATPYATPYVPPTPRPTPLQSVSNAGVAEEWVVIDRAVDGDTLKTQHGVTVRLIGVDTPETVDPRKPVQYFGKEASDFTKKLVGGKRVKLCFDQERTDKYGRMLAYAYLEDGTCVNAELIRQGYAHADTRFPFSKMEEFRQFEHEAREQKRGLWADEVAAAPTPTRTPAPAGTVFVTGSGTKFHTATCVFATKGKGTARQDAVARGLQPCSKCNP